MRNVYLQSFRRGWIPNPDDKALVGLETIINCNNIRVINGDVSKILGWVKTQIPVITGEIRLISIFTKNDGTAKLVVISERRFVEITSSNSFTDWTGVAFGINNEAVVATQFRDLFIFTNNHVTVKKWLGTAAIIADLGGLATVNTTLAKSLESNNEFLILANYVESGTRFNKRVRWCDRNAPEVWLSTVSNEAGDLDFDETPGEILRIKKLGQLNVIYKDDTIDFLIFVGFPFIHVRRAFTKSLGIIAVNAVEERNNIHYFVGNDFDIYKFDGINITSLGSKNGIKDFILANTDLTNKHKIHVKIHPQYNEVRFIFPHRGLNLKPFEELFEIIYNIEEGNFSKRDSISTASGSFKEIYQQFTSSTYSGLVSQNAGNQPSSLFGTAGTPVFKELIGDKNGFLYYYDTGDAFDTLDYEGFAEFGDDNFSFLRVNNIETRLKDVYNIIPIAKDQGKFYNINFYIGVRTNLNEYVKWHGPHKYKPNYSHSGLIPVRASGVIHRFKFGTAFKNQPFTISGIILQLEVSGEGR